MLYDHLSLRILIGFSCHFRVQFCHLSYVESSLSALHINIKIIVTRWYIIQLAVTILCRFLSSHPPTFFPLLGHSSPVSHCDFLQTILYVIPPSLPKSTLYFFFVGFHSEVCFGNHLSPIRATCLTLAIHSALIHHTMPVPPIVWSTSYFTRTFHVSQEFLIGPSVFLKRSVQIF